MDNSLAANGKWDTENTNNIRTANLIKTFNNSIFVVVLVDLPYVIPDKDDIKFFA